MKKTGCSNYLAAVDKNGLEGNEIYLDFKCNKFTCHKFKYIKKLEVGIPLSNIEFFARKKKVIYSIYSDKVYSSILFFPSLNEENWLQ